MAVRRQLRHMLRQAILMNSPPEVVGFVEQPMTAVESPSPPKV